MENTTIVYWVVEEVPAPYRESRTRAWWIERGPLARAARAASISTCSDDSFGVPFEHVAGNGLALQQSAEPSQGGRVVRRALRRVEESVAKGLKRLKKGAEGRTARKEQEAARRAKKRRERDQERERRGLWSSSWEEPWGPQNHGGDWRNVLPAVMCAFM